MNKFASNLKYLSTKYTQKQIAEKTGFSQSSINNYISLNSEPSMQFLIALNGAFGISIDDFLFSDINKEMEKTTNNDKFLGHYMAYYYDNSAYKGQIHNNLKNTLNYGLLSIVNNPQRKHSYEVYATFSKSRKEIESAFTKLSNETKFNTIIDFYKNFNHKYLGPIHSNSQNIFIQLAADDDRDECFMIFNNPSSNNDNYVGGIGTINSVSRGRENNPCCQYILLSKKLIRKPDNELYNLLQIGLTDINLNLSTKDLVELFKKLYVAQNDLSSNLSDIQKETIIENNLKYIFGQVINSNLFRFAKISNREDDSFYKIIKEE